MRKVLLTFGLAVTMAVTMPACSEAGNSDEKVTTEVTKKSDTTEEKKSETKVNKIRLDNREGSLTYLKHEVTKDYEGKPAIRVYFKYKNKSDDTKSAQSTFYVQLFQNGKEIDTGIADLDEKNEAEDNLSNELQKDASTTVAFIYELNDTKHNVTVKVTDQSSDKLLDNVYQEQTLSVK